MRHAGNPRDDRVKGVVQKAHDEVFAFLMKRSEKVPADIKQRISNETSMRFFGVGMDNPYDPMGGSPGILDRLKLIRDNNLYWLAADALTVQTAHFDLEDQGIWFGKDKSFGSVFNTAWANEFPEINKIIERRKISEVQPWIAHNYYHINTQLDFMEVVKHIDDMLQNGSIRQALRQRGFKTTPTMTIHDLEEIRLIIADIENEEALKAERRAMRGLVETPWQEMSSPLFTDPLHGQPPHKGVIPSGTIFATSGTRFKWVDISWSAAIKTAKYGRDQWGQPFVFFAPYEAFYVRHCGSDTGDIMLSLRVQLDEGWYPIALATLVNTYDGSLVITQLKTFKNARYEDLLDKLPEDSIIKKEHDLWQAEAINWLARRGVEPEDLERSVHQLLLDQRIDITTHETDDVPENFTPGTELADKYESDLTRFHNVRLNKMKKAITGEEE